MRTIVLAGPTDFDGWRAECRRLLAEGIRPDRVSWAVAGGSVDLFSRLACPAPTSDAATAAAAVPKAFLDLADYLIRHRDETRFALLYRLLWRQTMESDRLLLARRTDPEVARALQMIKEVRSDAYHMKAYLRFHEATAEDGTPHYLGWFQPQHYVTELAAPHFTERLGTLRWSIFTPDRSAHWDGEQLRFAEGATKEAVPTSDALVEHWHTYYASVFNPARLKVGAMLRQMPKKYWGNLSEADLIPDLVKSAHSQAAAMVAAAPKAPSARHACGPDRPVAPATATSLDELRSQGLQCRACPLWADATQVVFGEGPPDAQIMVVGEQPGDSEDLAGRPFAGPAGQLLDRALAEAGLDRRSLYVTNAVKHFKFEPHGKRRIHQTPGSQDVEACRGWLIREIALLKPRLIIAMGNTALKAALGIELPVSKLRGQVIEQDGLHILPTFHPAYLLRLPDPARVEQDYRLFVSDLLVAKNSVASAR